MSFDRNTSGESESEEQERLRLPDELAALDVDRGESTRSDSETRPSGGQFWSILSVETSLSNNLESLFGGMDTDDKGPFGGLLDDDVAGADRLVDTLGEDLGSLDDLLGEHASELGDLLSEPESEPRIPTPFFSQPISTERSGPSTESDESEIIQTLVDPGMLQMAAQGLQNDHYLPDGRYLRWTFASEMGFPRSGFRLYRRPSPPKISPKEIFAVRRSLRFKSNLSGGQIKTGNGLRVTHSNGVTVEQYDDHSYGVPLNETPTRVRFAESDAANAPELSTCWVSIKFARRLTTGSIAAVAVGEEGDKTLVQDRGGVGIDLRIPFEPLPVPENVLDNITEVQDVQVLEPNAEGSTLVGGQDESTESSGEQSESSEDSGEQDETSGGSMFGGAGLNNINIGPLWSGNTGFSGVGGGGIGVGTNPIPNSWVTGSLLLHGSVIDELKITGTDAMLYGVHWLPVQEYAETEGWEKVATFRLPIRGDGVFYPRASKPGRSIARDRLRDTPPKALPPWDEPSWPPAPNPSAVKTDQRKRYLRDGHRRLEEALDTILETEMTDAVRQESVTRKQTLSPDATTTNKLQGSEVELGLLDSVLTAAVDPQQATALGLATAETDRLDARFDYKLEADWPLLWWYTMLAPLTAVRLLNNYRGTEPDSNGVRLPIWSRTDQKPTTALEAMADAKVTVVSVATDIEATSSSPVSPPTDLSAEITPTPGESVPASVKLEWDADGGNLFTSGGHIAYAVRRKFQGTDEAIHHNDPDTGVTLPHMNASSGKASVTDHNPPGLGTATYRVSGMDVWGRFSDFAEITVEITDEVAPPAPTGLIADLVGDPNTATWDLELEFDWTAGQRELAPDTASFEILCEQGKVEPTTADGSRGFDNWDRAEIAPGTRERIQVAWPSLSVTSNRAGITTRVEPAAAAQDPTIDARVHVTIPDVTVPYDGDKAELSVTAVAVDSRGNPPTPATPAAGDVARRAVASRTAPREPASPSMPAGPQQTTWPDAQGNCHWTCDWSSQPPGSQTKVLRASQARLLSTADVAHEAFIAKSPGKRAEQLRRLAANNQQVFSPDHQEPYGHNPTGHSPTEHTVSLGGDDRGWTVVTVRHTGPTGTKAQWPGPDGFAVIAPRTARQPSTPRLSASPDTDSVRLRLEPDPSGAAKNVRLFRTSDPEAAKSLRRMRPLAFPNTSGSAADVPLQTNQPTTVTDDVPYADRWYAYRAVAESASGERSSPTEPVWVRASSSTPPPKPTVKSVEAVQGDDRKRRVKIKVNGYGLDLQLRRARAGTGDWTTLEQTPVADLSTVSSSSGERVVEIVDEVPKAGSSWAYTYTATVEDRRGRTATSDTTTQGGN